MIDMNEQDILDLVARDSWMMGVLRVARSMHLPDWMIGAGFVRNKVWDHLHGYPQRIVDTADIDLIYYDDNDVSQASERACDVQLHEQFDAPWSCKNQARMHEKHGRTEQYKNSTEALSEWVETPTCVAVRLEDDNTLTLFAPHGITDLVNLAVRPTPCQRGDLAHFYERIESKRWLTKWPKLRVDVSWRVEPKNV